MMKKAIREKLSAQVWTGKFAAQVWTGDQWITLALYGTRRAAELRNDRGLTAQERRVAPANATDAACVALRTAAEMREMRRTYGP